MIGQETMVSPGSGRLAAAPVDLVVVENQLDGDPDVVDDRESDVVPRDELVGNPGDGRRDLVAESVVSRVADAPARARGARAHAGNAEEGGEVPRLVFRSEEAAGRNVVVEAIRVVATRSWKWRIAAEDHDVSAVEIACLNVEIRGDCHPDPRGRGRLQEDSVVEEEPRLVLQEENEDLALRDVRRSIDGCGHVPSANWEWTAPGTASEAASRPLWSRGRAPAS